MDKERGFMLMMTAKDQGVAEFQSRDTPGQSDIRLLMILVKCLYSQNSSVLVDACPPADLLQWVFAYKSL